MKSRGRNSRNWLEGNPPRCTSVESVRKENVMSRYSLVRGSITVVLLVLVAFGAATAQESRGSLTGKVNDQNGAVLPGATAVLKNVETNVTSTTTTNDEGSYTFPLLQPGKYSLTVTANGFATVTRDDIQISVSEKRTVDVAMQVTGVGEMVDRKSTRLNSSHQ